ncbi:MAG: (2Fe-2S)-binding protein [Burkholderiales bacterium]|nr:(2Fe-2S)-binding protein [Burkholderiales bacterium]
MHIRTGVARGEPVTFSFEGRTLRGYAGESVAAALWAAGVRGAAADPAYRALFCAMGACQQCAVWIDRRTPDEAYFHQPLKLAA